MNRSTLVLFGENKITRTSFTQVWVMLIGPTLTSVNVKESGALIVETAGCGSAGMAFGTSALWYVSQTSSAAE